MADDFKKYSIESKILFGLVFTSADSTTSLLELASIITQLGKNELFKMRGQLKDPKEDEVENE
jgi:hypothetical protein